MAQIRSIASTCQGCLTNCSVLVQVENGRAVGVAGNSASPATEGAICRNAEIALQQEVDPDRVLQPLRRTNPHKGRFEDPAWQIITWDDALDEIADRLMALRNRDEGHKLVVMKGRSTGIGGLLTSAFPAIYGTPNSLNHDSICDQGETVALGCLDGVWDYRGVDYSQCDYLLLWGMDPLASNRWKSQFRRALPQLKRHAKIVCVDPRLSLTGKTADEWHAIVPGTDGALACALAHVIVAEGLYDRCFVEEWTQGLREWWDFALRDATPEWAEGICGITADDIRRLAHEFAAAGRRAASWTSPGLAMVKRGFYGCMAAQALNGLVGSVGAGGCMISYPSIPKGKLPDVKPFQDQVALRACALEPIDQRHRLGFMSAKGGRAGAGQNSNYVPEALAQGGGEIDTLIAYWCNYAYSAPGCQRWWKMLADIPFFVDVTTHVSESTWFADIVLPARHHMLETWGIANSRQNGVACVSLAQPCVAAPGQALGDETDVPFLLAEKLAQRGFPNLLDYYRSFSDPHTGEHPHNGGELGQCAVKLITRSLWGSSSWEEVLERGVLAGPSAALGAAGDKLPFNTPSGRFEFKSSHLQDMLQDYASLHGLSLDQALESLDYEALGPLALVPHYETPVRVGDPALFPLVFSQHRAHASLEGRAANTQLFQELKGTDPGDEPWDDVVKLHPDDMRQLGLADGDAVRVVSPQGSIRCHAKGWEGTRCGVAVKCYGQGHWAYGQVAAGIGGNNNEIVPAQWERITSSAVRHGGIVRVRVERCGEDA